MTNYDILKQFSLSDEDFKEIEAVKRRYPMRVGAYYLSLIKEKNDPIWKQCIPSGDELKDNINPEDPLHEEQYMPVPHVIHRYPDRVLLMVANSCAMYCRFCTRKRKVGKQTPITREDWDAGIKYISEHKEIRDVIVSGGDPLTLKNTELDYLLSEIKKIEHVEIIRIGTRIPCTSPKRVTRALCRVFRKYQPLYINLHFEHPAEITPESSEACRLLADSGAVLGNQCVMLKGVNDDPDVLKELFHKLLKLRVKPYYIYQADQVKGTEHFRTTVQESLSILKGLYGNTSGLCLPQFVIDTCGGGKIPVLPDFLKEMGDELVLENFEKKIIKYRNSTPQNKPKVAVVYNLKRQPEPGEPEDKYAEFDDIDVPTAIQTALVSGGYNAELVEADLSFINKMRGTKYDFVFNIAEGTHGESRESQVPAILDMLKIPYTGSGVLTQAITLDKRRTKEVMLFRNLNTPKFQLFETPDQELDKSLKFPLFVKPNSEGSSKGIRNNSIVNNEEELRDLLRHVVGAYNQPALVEEYLDGREFTVSIIGNENPQVLPIVEVTFDYLPEGINRIDSFEVKWHYDNPNNPIDPIICPAKITPELKEKIETLAVQTYRALGVVDFCRMDMRLDANGNPSVIDVNALPGLMPDPKENSRFPKSCYTHGMSYNEIILKILDEARGRYGQK